jgi:hypothetical protein
MIKKINTLWAVFRTYGISELWRLIYRKVFQVKIYTEFPVDITFESSERFMATIEHTPPQAREIVHPNEDKRNGFFGPIYDLGPELSSALHGLLREKRPNFVVETGVAAGKSTNLILNQLRINKIGHLVSFDVTKNVGELIELQNKFFWTLEVLPSINRKQYFKARLREYSKATVFLHDSDHSVAWQLFEIKHATTILTELAYLLVDDIQPSVASFLLSKYGKGNCYFFNESGQKKSLIVRTFANR